MAEASKTGLQGVAVGDELMVSQFAGRYRPATVTAVGRKWLTANGSKYEIATGVMQGQYLGRAQTLQQHATEVERSEMIRELGIANVLVGGARLTADQVRQILAIVRGGAE